MGKLSPLMDQYFTIKKQCDDAILLFRMGDFYETFGDDAVVAARDLNITLTSRQKDDSGNKIPLAGIPYHALEAYLPRLLRAGHKVAICEQVEDPKLARGLVRRELVRIVTPGTVLDPCMLEEGTNNYLAALVREGNDFGLALVDVSTGEFLVARVPEDGLSSELSSFQPAECLVISAGELPAECRLVLDRSSSKIQEVDSRFFDLAEARCAIEGHFKESSISELGLDDCAPCLRAAGAVLSYLHCTHFDALGHVTTLRKYSNRDFMVLDEVTLRNLEIFKSIVDGSKRGTLMGYLDRTLTPTGSRTLRHWLRKPLLSPEAVNRRQDAVEELTREALLRSELAGCLKGLGDMERLVGRISCGTATPKDLRSLQSSLERLPLLYQALSGAQSSCLRELFGRLELGDLRGLADLLARSLVDDPPSSVKDGGVIRDGYHQELDELRTILRDGKGWIARLESQERDRTGIRSLKVSFNNVFGYFIEVTKPNIPLVPEDYVRKQTLANAERYVTPALKEMESRVVSAQERSISLEQEIFSSVRSQAAGHAEDIQRRAGAVGELDALLSLAQAALEGTLVRPEINGSGAISLRESRHPVLDREMRQAFVPNDVYLDQEQSRFIILTGPNMAGKSTFMRQIALTAIMAQMGSFVPASYASLGMVDRIFTRVGAYDDLVAGRSTFMVEMEELANILRSATSRSLILLDEIGRGTSTFDGLSIAWAVTEYIHTRLKAKTVFATHYHQLTQLSDQLPGVVNCNMAVKEEGDSITFLRTVIPGATDRSYGVHVARLAGVPEEVVRRARAILKEVERQAVIDVNGRGRPGRTGGKRSPYTQLIFFDSPEKSAVKGSHPLLVEILALNLAPLTWLGDPRTRGNVQVSVHLFNGIRRRRHDELTCLIDDEDFEYRALSSIPFHPVMRSIWWAVSRLVRRSHTV